jgi:uroporphyrinogen-III synthase
MSLRGRGIVVTRPRELAQNLAALIEAAGGRPILFPAIAIEELAAPPVLRELQRFDLAIFVSPSAVQTVMTQLRSLPRGLQVAAVGAGTRRELEKHAIEDVIAPTALADSEALLALPELFQVKEKRVVILRGQGGRSLLGDTLVKRGASVKYAECYRRVAPRSDPAGLLAAWQRGEVHAVSVSSGEGLENLAAMLGKTGEGCLQRTPLFVPHARVAAQAARLGVREAVLAGPGDDEMIERLVAYFSE